MEENSINRGGSPKKLLEERGMSYEGGSVLPEIPDFLSYLLGFLLIWLLYTGYQSVVGVFSGISPVAKSVSAELKTKLKSTKVAAEETGRKLLEEGQRARLAAPEQVAEKTAEAKGWFSTIFDFLNESLDELSSEAGKEIRHWVDGTESTTVEENPIEEQALPPKNTNDALVSF
jgi:hypothetical protein